MKSNCLKYILIGAAALAGCTKSDDYKKFQTKGELIYPGIVDFVKVFAGKNRVMVRGLITSDPNITRCRIFWNNRQDSIEIPISRTGGVDTVKAIINDLKEGAVSLELRTYDGSNNRSIPIFVVGNNYGTQYEQGVNNRSVISSAVSAGGLTLNWLAAAVTSPFTNVSYQTNAGTTISKKVLSAELTSVLPDYKYGTAVLIRSAYLPEATAFDTFYAAKPDTVRKFNALAGVFVSGGLRTNYTGAAANNVVAGTTVLSGDKTAVELNARQIEVDYANLGGSGWKYVFNYENGVLTVAPNATLAGGIKAGSFKILQLQFDNSAGKITVKTEYTNTAGDARVVEETLQLK